VTSRFRALTEGRFGRLLLPAIVLQSVLIGGGYATGREIVAYGARFGPRGWIAVATIFVGFTVISFLTFEVARQFRTYEYKGFIRVLIGAAWPAFDLLYLVMSIVVIAVMASAAANILHDTLGAPPLVGTAAVILAAGVLTYHGSEVIEAFKSVGTLLLYIAYLLFSALVLGARWDGVRAAFSGAAAPAATGVTASSAGVSVLVVLGTGIVYVGYNLGVYPAVLFTLHRQTERRDAALSAVVSGFLMTLPFLLTWLCLMAFYPSPAVFDAPVPWLPMLRSVGGAALLGLFGVVMGWTLLETSVGMIHAILDRIDADLERIDAGPLAHVDGLSPLASGLLGGGILFLAALLSRVGIIALVERGYTVMGYCFIALFALPLLTVGAWKTLAGGAGRAPGAASGAAEGRLPGSEGFE